MSKIFNFIPALALNLLKGILERSKKPFNKFRASAVSLNAVFTAELSRIIRASRKEIKQHQLSLMGSGFPLSYNEVGQTSGKIKNLIKNHVIGFSLLELLIVIAIIGIIGAIVVPNFQQRTPRYERESFIARFNTLVQFGWQQALRNHKVHRVTVDVGKKLITLAVDSEQKDKSGESTFIPIENAVEDTQCIIPDQILIKQFFIEGFDMMAKFSRSKTASMWFYIVPEGMVQNVVINFNDTKDVFNNHPRPIGLVLNPFSAQFKAYDTFQKP